MSEQEKKTGGSAAGGSSVVVVEQSTASRHKPYRPTDLQDEATPDLHHKRSRAPAVPSVAEELKDSAENPEIKERRECERAMSSEKHKQSIAKKLSSSTKRQASSPEAIILAPLEAESKRSGTITPPSQPIPAQVASVASAASDLTEKTDAEQKLGDDDSITEEIAELRTSDPSKRASEWSDDEEAGGLPRSDSRASRVSRASRAVRQLFCCGVPYEAPSEEDISSPSAAFKSGV